MAQSIPLEILIVEDHPLMAGSIAAYLQSMQIHARSVTVRSLAQAKKRMFKRDKPDLIITDLNLPDSSGLETIRELRSVAPDQVIMVFSMDESPETAKAALAAGAQSYVSKSSLPEHFIHQIKVHLGAVKEQPARPAPRYLTDIHPMESLTARQKTVLAELAAGYSNRELARKLRISEETIHSHLSEIFQRLGVQNRTQASVQYLTWAQKSGLLA
jgi:two-component system nitrate/nitrite response regulator NarL